MTTGLDWYAEYWYAGRGFGKESARRRMREIREPVSGTWGSAGDPLGSQTPAAQNQMYKHLKGMARSGAIDDWAQLVDPTVSYGENKAIILRKGGDAPDSDLKNKELDWRDSMDERQLRHAANTIRDSFDDIETGDAEGLKTDITAEFGSDFLASVLEEERIRRESPTGGAPDPTPEPIETEPDPTPEPVKPVESVESTAPEPTEAAAEPATTAETVAPEPATATPDYSGLFGTLRLVVDHLTASYRKGYESGRDAEIGTKTQQQITDY